MLVCFEIHRNMKLALGPYLTIDLGDHDLSTLQETNNKVVRVVKIIPNVHFNNIDNDIALLKLAVKVDTTDRISPVCLPSAGINVHDALNFLMLYYNSSVS